MKKLLFAALLTGGLVAAVGCSGDAKKGDPKLSPDAKIDPRLKPADAGGGGAPGPHKAQGQIKGD